jgi:hypothetical protein
MSAKIGNPQTIVRYVPQYIGSQLPKNLGEQYAQP